MMAAWNAAVEAQRYRQMDQRTHVYEKPAAYIGSDEPVLRGEYLYDFDTGVIVQRNVDYVEGCERLFHEILSNAYDNVERSRLTPPEHGEDPSHIEVRMDATTFTITNYGNPIPIELNKQSSLYAPELIFGNLLTSSNYDQRRRGAGTNGIGAKATNVFSQKFMVDISSKPQQLRYHKKWYHNMRQIMPPRIESCMVAASQVTVSYVMDFARFGYSFYPLEAFQLAARACADVSFTCKIPVRFNDILFNAGNIQSYLGLYLNSLSLGSPKFITSNQSPITIATSSSPSGGHLELAAVDAPDAGHVSFVNNMMTRDGGVHVMPCIKAISEGLLECINESLKKSKSSVLATINDVKPHLFMIISIKVSDPKFRSQTKAFLSSPKVKVTIPEETCCPVKQWNLAARVKSAVNACRYQQLSKTDGKLSHHVKLRSGINANNAGKSGCLECVLYITEGESGACYANKLISFIPTAQDNIGVLPLRGKLLNVLKASPEQIEANHEIAELKQMLGLCEGTNYSDDAEFHKLRYGNLMIMADSDVDGKHIISLVVNFFHQRFPSLLSRGFLCYYSTPIIRVWPKSGNPLRFYD